MNTLLIRGAIHMYFIHTLDYIELFLSESCHLSDITPMVHRAQLVPLRPWGSASEDETVCLPGQLYSPVFPQFLLLFNPSHPIFHNVTTTTTQ